MSATKIIKATISWTVTILLVALVVALIGIRLMGWHGFTVLTGSMLPNIAPGDVVLVSNEKPQVGDPATFVTEQGLVTHRVVEVTDSSYITAGDATGVRDEPHDPRNLVGKVEFVIPKLGWLGPQGPVWPWPLAITVGLLVMAISWPIFIKKYVPKHRKK